VEKVRVLVAAGADVNARSQIGFSPLLVASQYVEATPAIRLLLEHGARVTIADGEAPPAANATPVFFAAHAGNVEILPTLVKAGARVDVATNFVGLRNEAIPPLVVAARFGRTDVARALLGLGAPHDQANTALATAVSSNHPELVQFLLDRGADVNVVDRTGRTPLIHAAKVDFGHSTIVDMLLAAGSRTDVRDEEGLTALERARRDGNRHVIPSLERAERRR
jgi:26S proteasome non-ATPase regulatory subunit 10